MRPLIALLLLTALWAGMYLPGLGMAELKGEEGRRILPAREMLRRDDYILPYSEGRPYHRKPPGINWAIAGVFSLTKVQNEFTARLPSVLGILALALAGYAGTRRILGNGGAFALGIALLFNAALVQKGRLAEIEALYVSLCGIGMLLWASAWASPRSPWKIWLGGAIPFALANLVKGPVWMVFFYGIVIASCFRAKRMRELLHPAHFLSMAIALAPMLIWGGMVKERMKDMPPVVVVDDEGGSMLARAPEDVWWHQISGRLNFTNIDWADWAMLPLRSFVQFLPWPLLAFGASWMLRRRPAGTVAGEEEDHTDLDSLRWGVGWGSVITAALFCLLPATRSRYLLPLAAPVALWSVLALQRCFADEALKDKAWLWMRRFVLALAGALAIAGIALPFFLLRGWPWTALAFNIGAIALLLVWIVWAITDKLPERFYSILAGPFLFIAAISTTTLLPWGRTVENVRPVAARINALTPVPGVIAVFNPGPQPFLFYLGTRCLEVTKITDFPPEGVTYVLISPKDWAREDLRAKLESRDFTHELLRFKDERSERDREYLLMGRPEDIPPPAPKPPE